MIIHSDALTKDGRPCLSFFAGHPTVAGGEADRRDAVQPPPHAN